DEAFDLPLAVHLRRVDVHGAEIERPANGGNGRSAVVAFHVPGTLSDDGDGHAGWAEGALLHGSGGQLFRRAAPSLIVKPVDHAFACLAIHVNGGLETAALALQPYAEIVAGNRLSSPPLHGF